MKNKPKILDIGLLPEVKDDLIYPWCIKSSYIDVEIRFRFYENIFETTNVELIRKIRDILNDELKRKNKQSNGNM